MSRTKWNGRVTAPDITDSGDQQEGSAVPLQAVARGCRVQSEGVMVTLTCFMMGWSLCVL